MTLNELMARGVVVSLIGDDKLKASVPNDLATPELREEILESKPQLIEELKAKLAKGDALLAIWRRDSIPQWRDILENSTEKGNYLRRDYALWMLREILQVEG
jgi:hypothetical protein